MTREDVAEIVHGMPQGMDADDYLVELVIRAILREREACARVCENMERNGDWITKEEAAAAIRANRSLATTSKPNYCTPQVTPQVTPEVTGGVDLAKVGEVGVWGDSQALVESANSTTNLVEPKASSQTEQGPPANKYNEKQIAWELERTALGDGYYGNALYVAMDMPQTTKADKEMLHRYMCGSNLKTDHIKLQELAMRIYTAPPKKEWAGLTREDKDDLVYALPEFYSMEDVILATEAKLKEKNT